MVVVEDDATRTHTHTHTRGHSAKKGEINHTVAIETINNSLVPQHILIGSVKCVYVRDRGGEVVQH